MIDTMRASPHGSEIPVRMMQKAQLAFTHAHTTELELCAILEQGWMDKKLKDLRQKSTAALDSMKQNVDMVNAVWNNWKAFDDSVTEPADPNHGTT